MRQTIYKYNKKSIALLLVVGLLSPSVLVFAQEASITDTMAPTVITTDIVAETPLAEAVALETTADSLIADTSVLPDETQLESTNPVASEIQPEATEEGNNKDKNDKKNEVEEGSGEVQAMAMSASSSEGESINPSSNSHIKIDVDQATGSLTYRYSLTLPVGRNNMTPTVDLIYNSEDKNNNSELGLGWSLSIPKIERMNKKGADVMYNNNDFRSSLSGELKYISGNIYRAKVEEGSFLNYQFNGIVWMATAKDGAIYTFGDVENARVSDPNNSSMIHTWYVTKVQDTNGNSINYEYYKDVAANSVYPYLITYTNNGTEAGVYKVEFTTEYRPDSYKDYSKGFSSLLNKRISEIKISANNIWTKKYIPNYEVGDNGLRSMLKSITEIGRDESMAETIIPPFELSYTPVGHNFVNNSDFTYPELNPSVNFSNTYVRVMDVNGDGLKDIVNSGYNGGPIFWVAKNNGNGWELDTSWTQPTYIYKNSEGANVEDIFYFDAKVVAGDWNGDGRDDLVKFSATPVSGGSDVLNNIVLINNGSGWVQDMNVTATPTAFYEGRTIHIQSGNSRSYFGDLNGDGLMDYMYAESSQINGVYYPDFAVWYNQNGNLVWDSSVVLPWVNDTAETIPLTLSSGVRSLDVNNDGLVDFMSASKDYSNNRFWVLLNNGHGWTQDQTITYPAYNNSNSEYFLTSSGAGWVVMDINGDRLPDLARLWNDGTKGVLINNGHGWRQNDSAITVGQYNYVDLYGNTITEYPNSASTTTMFFDATGDGLDDIVNFGYYGAPVIWMLENTGQQANLLSRADFPEGGSYTFGYKQTSMYRDGSGNLLNPNFPASYNTLNSITFNDGVGNLSTNTYEYADASFYYKDMYDRKVAGFGKVTVTDPASIKNVAYFYLGNDLQPGETGIDPLDGSLIGKPYLQELYNNSGGLISQSYVNWASQDLGNERDFVYQSRVVSSENGKQKASEYAYDLSNGNLLQEINYGKVSVIANNFSDIENDKKTTNFAYTTSGSIQPTSVEVLSQSGQRINKQNFYYDNQPFGIATLGNQTKAESWISGSSYSTSQKTYNSYGLVVSQTDPNNNITTYAYDAYNMYPAIVTNQLNQQTSYQYNYGIGKVKQITDTNGFIYQSIYDGFGRLVQEKIPGETTPYTPAIKTVYQYTDVKNAFSVKKTDYLDSSLSKESIVYFDGFNRPIQERFSTENAGSYSAKDTVYNNLGLVDKKSLPYLSSGEAKTSPTSQISLYENYTYDALRRPVTISNAVGIVNNSYNGWKTTVTDAMSVPKDFTYDAYGNLIQVDEHNNTDVYSTVYGYDGNNKLTKITDALGNIRNFIYDGLGRRLSAEDLHAVADSTFGTWIYSYDLAGNIISSIDPKSQIINYGYDGLNRIISKNYAGQAGIENTYTYDNCLNGIGKLCSVSADGVQDAYLYDSRGQISSHTKTIAPNTYQTAYAYDRQGNQLTIINPDNSQVKYTYNTAGRIETVQRKESTDSGFVSVVNNMNYGAHGKINSTAYSNGVSSTNTYDENKLYRLTNKTTTNSSGTNLQNVSYLYDANGNITQTTDNSQTVVSKTVNYVYDDLNRLLQATASNVASGQEAYNLVYTYDAVGNILTRQETIGTNPTVAYVYSYNGNQSASFANPHAVTSITNGTTTTSTYTYDNNGNMIADGSKTYTFDYNNRMAQALVPGSEPLPPAPVTATFYPAAGDGSIYNTNGVWNTARSAASGTSANYTATTFNTRTGKSGSSYLIERSFLPFNTASLPDNAQITSAKLKIFVQSKLNNDNDGDDWITIVQGSQPNTTSLTTADYDLAGALNSPAEGINATERKDITNITTGQYVTFNLNTTGKGWVSLTGSTKLALREGHDVINSAFTGSSGKYNQITTRSVAYSGTTSDPVLEITYTVPPPPPPTNTLTYAYDSSGQRVKINNPSASSGQIAYYPTKNYNTDGTKTAKHIFADSAGIATIDGTGATAKIYYNSTDYLNSSSIMTDSLGGAAETMDYFPYGGIRIDNKVSSFTEQRKFIGEEYDVETGLNYLNARYYDAGTGRFVSQDPAYLNLSELETQLSDPQSWNSYSYARGNPIVYSDQNGDFPLLIPLAYATPYIIAAGTFIATQPALAGWLANNTINDVNTVSDKNASTSEKAWAWFGIGTTFIPGSSGAKSSAIVAEKGLALSFTNSLKEFSKKVGAPSYLDFKDELLSNLRHGGAQMAEGVTSAMWQAKSLYFNLDKFNISEALEFGYKDFRSNQASLSSEFVQIIGNKDLLNKTTFYLNGIVTKTEDVLKQASEINHGR